MRRRNMAILAAVAATAVGGGAAIAATQDDGREAEDAILADAAERLDVEPAELRSALSEAEAAQIDRAVEEGRLTEEQAARIKEHMQQSGRVLGFPGGPHHGPGGPGGPGGPAVFGAIAEELGISEERLHEQLRSGKRLRAIARANGKTLDDVRAAARAAIEQRLDEDVEAGRLTEEQAERIRQDIPQMLRHLVRGPRIHGGPGGRGRPGGPPPGMNFGPPPRDFRG